jgi:hypothetical protein
MVQQSCEELLDALYLDMQSLTYPKSHVSADNLMEDHHILWQREPNEQIPS